MKIILPMAGFGKRLRPHTWSKPKPLITIAGKPILAHVLDGFENLPAAEELIFILGYLGQQIQAYVQQTYPQLKCRYVLQEELIGQSHAIWLARQGLEGPVLIVFVDTLIEADLSALDSESAEAVVWVKEVPDPRRFGVADVGPDGWVRRLTEKPKDMKNNLAIVGFYYFKQAERLLAAIEEQMAREIRLGGEFFLADAIQIMLKQGLRMRVEPVEIWKDCGKPEALLETNRYLLENGRDNSAQVEKQPGVVILPPVHIHPSAQLRDSILGPYVSIAAKCVIQESIVRDSIIEAGALISGSVLSSSLIGQDARVEGHSRSLNIGDSAHVSLS